MHEHDACGRTFKTSRGLGRHISTCEAVKEPMYRAFPRKSTHQSQLLDTKASLSFDNGSSKKTPLNGVRDGKVEKTSASKRNTTSGKVLHLTHKNFHTEIVAKPPGPITLGDPVKTPSHNGENSETEDYDSQDSARPRFGDDHSGTEGDETEENVAEDEDDDDDEDRERSRDSIEGGSEVTEANGNARLANQAMVDNIAWTHDVVDEDIFTVRMKRRGGSGPNEEEVTEYVEGTYTHLADANASALRCFRDEFRFFPHRRVVWDVYDEQWNGSGHVRIYGESREEGMVDIFIERSTLTRRVPKP
ncbi:MAG: hypothetical protein Q9202_003146 [Teloschistes flavicans]